MKDLKEWIEQKASEQDEGSQDDFQANSLSDETAEYADDDNAVSSDAKISELADQIAKPEDQAVSDGGGDSDETDETAVPDDNAVANDAKISDVSDIAAVSDVAEKRDVCTYYTNG